jgi:hypothetical protein
MFAIMDEPFMNRINIIYQLLSDNTLLFDKMEEQLIKLIVEFKDKLDKKFA